MTTSMTPEDLIEGQKLADKIVEMIKPLRPPAAVAGVALALAAVAHLAECGPDAARHLFDRYFKTIDDAAGAFTVGVMVGNPAVKS